MVSMKGSYLLTLACLAPVCGFGQHVGSPTNDLDKVSVDELFSIQVTSVGHKAQKISKAAAAIFVLTAEDIKRSGATCIPEALQWVPGLTVLRVDGRSWVVSARGGARVYSDKMLVMIDGRSLYTPLFSGVIWDSIDVPMDDIEQIEVVRGPGAVMWGPNAVNGVINIITRQARATQGAQVSLAAGNELRGGTEARWGAAPSDKIAYRVWGKASYSEPGYDSPGYFRFNNSLNYVDPHIQNLDTGTARLGFRVEGQPTPKDQWMVQGDMYRMDGQDPVAYPVLLPNLINEFQSHADYQGGYLQGKWTHTASAGNEIELRFSYDRNDLTYPYAGGSVHNLTFDFQKRRQTGEHNELYWGTGFQQYWDETNAGGPLTFSPANSVYRSGYGVVRDEWQFVPNRLMVSAGIRLDYESYGKLEYQPSFHLLYTPDSQQSAWVGVSRAVRTPSRFDRDVRANSGLVEEFGYPVQTTLVGSTDFHSEVERSLEAGYRMQSGQHWSFDVSGFWSYYNRMRILAGPTFPEVSFSGNTLALTMPLTFNNAGTGRNYGGEISGAWRLLEHWRLIPSYSYLNETRWKPAASPYFAYWWDGTPATLPHQVRLRSEHDLSRSLKLDLMARAWSRDTPNSLPGALLLDVRIAWRPARSTELSFAVQNLADRHLLEAYPEIGTPSIPIRRTCVLKLTQRF